MCAHTLIYRRKIRDRASIMHDDCQRYHCYSCCNDRMKGPCWSYMCIKHIISVQLCESIEFHVCSPAKFNTHTVFLLVQKYQFLHEDYYCDYCLWWIHTSPGQTNRFWSEETCKTLHFYVTKVPKERIDWAWICVK